MDYELIKPDKDDAYDPAPFLSYARMRATDKAERDPSIGDIVHYWTGGECGAAIVTRDDLDSVCLTVLWPEDTVDESHRLSGIQHDEGKAMDTWHWPCGGL